MKTMNRVTLMGHLAADPELRETVNGHKVANFALATNRLNAEKQEVADFHRVIAWNKLGEMCSERLKKGMPLFIEGKLINRSFEDKEGNKHYRTEIVADELIFLAGKSVQQKPELQKA